MADLSITAASVIAGTDATVLTGTAGEVITAGQSVYYNSTTSKWLKAQSDGTTAEAGNAGLGIALTGSSTNQSINLAITGTITIGATVVAATQYIISSTAGGICPIADLPSSNYLGLLCYANSTQTVVMNKLATGVQK